MSYDDVKRDSGLFFRLKIRFARILITNFPLNSVRIRALKLCGFKVGKKVYIGPGLIVTMFNSRSDCHLEIGDRVSIGPRVTLVLSSNSNWSRLNEFIKPKEGKIVLEDDCWLGAGVIVLPDITIGKMSAVGAGAVVTEDTEPYFLYAGVPARKIRKLEN